MLQLPSTRRCLLVLGLATTLAVSACGGGSSTPSEYVPTGP